MDVEQIRQPDSQFPGDLRHRNGWEAMDHMAEAIVITIPKLLGGHS